MEGMVSPEPGLRASGATLRAFPPKTRSRFTLLSLQDCAAAPPRGYRLKGLIAPGDLVVMFGPPGAAKSAVAPYIAHAIATGRHAFGRRVRQCPVLYVSPEDPAGMKNRQAAILSAYGDAPALRLIAESVDMQGDGVGDPPDVDAIAAEADGIGAGLIVIDTLAKAFPGLDENDPRSMGRAVRLMRKLTTPTRAVLAIHHSPKGGSTPRGHGALNGDADVTMRIEVDQATGVRTVHLDKNRNGPTAALLTFTIRGEELGTDEDGDAITAVLAEEAEEQQGAALTARQKAEARLRDEVALLLRELRSLAAAASLAMPEQGMPLVPAVERSQLRARLLSAGWFTEDERRASVPSDGNALLPITRAAQRREGKALDALKRKGFAGFNARLAWPT
jgi:predicted ATP-dependent serine protease